MKIIILPETTYGNLTYIAKINDRWCVGETVASAIGKLVLENSSLFQYIWRDKELNKELTLADEDECIFDLTERVGNVVWERGYDFGVEIDTSSID